MRTKKVVCFFIVLLLFSTVTCSVGALPDTTVTFRGGGITINLTYPEEAHPNDNIWHNATLTANIALTLRNLTLVIRSPVDSVWQDVTSWSLSNRVLQENATLTEEMNFQLPSNANGTLQCFIYINSSQSSDYLSSTFYTTRVSELTFSEMQILYNEMLANYTTLQTNYTTLLNDYDDLLANYSSLFANYTALLSLYYETLANYTALQADYTTLLNDHDDLLANYTSLFANYTALFSEHNQLLANYTTLKADYATLSNSINQRENQYTTDYNSLNALYTSQRSNYIALQSDYDLLNSTFYGVQTNYGTLQAVYDALDKTYTDLQREFANLQERSESALNSDRIVMFIFVIALVALIAFIIYLKRGKEEPYVVIRKETVSMNQDEKS